MRRRTAPRSTTVVAAHAGCAAFAAATAASTSSAPERGTRVSTLPSAGERFSIVSPDAAACSRPPMMFVSVAVMR